MKRDDVAPQLKKLSAVIMMGVPTLRLAVFSPRSPCYRVASGSLSPLWERVTPNIALNLFSNSLKQYDTRSLT